MYQARKDYYLLAKFYYDEVSVPGMLAHFWRKKVWPLFPLMANKGAKEKCV